jgi:hypothetical protein
MTSKSSGNPLITQGRRRKFCRERGSVLSYFNLTSVILKDPAALLMYVTCEVPNSKQKRHFAK